VLFEHFANYCIISTEYEEEFDVESVHVGGSNDLQLDGIAVIVNGILVESKEAVDDLLATNKYIDAEFILVQSKSGKGFDGADISNLFFGCRDLFDSTPKLPRNPSVQAKEDIIKHIYTKSASFKSGNPKLSLFYVTTGKWTDDTQLVARVEQEKSTLDDMNIFKHPVHFYPIDARRIQKLYNQSQNTQSHTFTFSFRLTLPVSGNVREAYLGFLSAKEYISLLRDDNGNLRRGLFYENVRDFQGDNLVNKEINDTLNTDQKEDFVLMNNGVTIVADDLKVTRDDFTISGFQIVNGCQTSHVLFQNAELLGPGVHIPLKLIVAPNDELKTQVIKATNRQTVVKIEELSALTDFQKHLEHYYAAIPDLQHRLYYERRSQQFRSASIEKLRIITISTQIRAFASMFLGKAHQASRYYGTLLKDVEQQIFRPQHPAIAYYVSAYALFKVDGYLRKKDMEKKYRPFKYHVLHATRILLGGYELPSMASNKFEKYCGDLCNELWDEDRCLNAVLEACKLIDTLVGDDLNRDGAKNANLNSRISETLRANASA